MRFKLTIEYDGGPFQGWQRNAGGPSVQGALEDAVRKLTGVQSDVIGAGRTDAGVHAAAQVAHVDIEKPFEAWKLAEALNVKAPTVSKTIARLSLQSLVERKVSDTDGRLVRVGLTEAGRQRAAAIAGLADQIEHDLSRGLDGKDRKRLRRLLRKVAKNLAKASGRASSVELSGADDDEAEELDAA